MNQAAGQETDRGGCQKPGTGASVNETGNIPHRIAGTAKDAGGINKAGEGVITPNAQQAQSWKGLQFRVQSFSSCDEGSDVSSQSPPAEQHAATDTVPAHTGCTDKVSTIKANKQHSHFIPQI